MDNQQIDREKLRAALRRLRNQDVFYMLDEAIELLPPEKLLKLVKGYFDTSNLQTDTKVKRSFLAEVQAFEEASSRGEYFDSFDVNSKNYMEQSKGTSSWIAECTRLFARCVAEAQRVNPSEILRAFDILFELLDRIDRGDDEIIFFADEGGSWQVGVDWSVVLPCWFKVLSATCSSEEYADKCIFMIKSHYTYDKDKMLDIAKEIASPDQQRALAEVSARETNRHKRR